jgi:hypothetical protein
LQSHLSSIRASLSEPLEDQAHVVHFLVDVRSVIELSGGFRKLKFFCSWPLHPQMTHRPVREIMEWLDGLMDNADKNQYRALKMLNEAPPFTSLHEFREELFGFLSKYGLDTSLIADRDRWIPFLESYVALIEKNPLIDGQSSFRNIDEVRIKRMDKPSTPLRPTDCFMFGIEWFFMHKGIRRLPLVNDVVF